MERYKFFSCVIILLYGMEELLDMKRILMNKNVEVLLVEYDAALRGFSKIIDVYNVDYCPYILKSYYNSEDDCHFRLQLSEWFRGREIPSWRDKLDLLLQRLNIHTSEELLDKAFGLSLSD